MTVLDTLDRRAPGGGVYLDDLDVSTDEVLAFAERRGFRLFRVEGERIRDKRGFMNEIARALDFPDYFGGTWDALLDSLRDLECAPAPGWVILFGGSRCFAQSAPSDYDTAIAVFEDAAAFWEQHGARMYVLLQDGDGPSGPSRLSAILSGG
jgi:RNAse (barnase) inhibitor barstar